MNIYFDTEFTGLHRGTSLISIGLVADDGKTFYAECNDYSREQVNLWIKKNVINRLYFKDQLSLPGGKYRQMIEADTIANEVYLCSMEQLKGHLTQYFGNWENVQLVSDVCHYDMTLLIDIFGSAFDLPKHVNPACHDINQDIARVLHISEAEAFDQNRERLLDVFAKKLKNEGVYSFTSLNDVCPKKLINLKHNSMFDAHVIKLIYDYTTILNMHW